MKRRLYEHKPKSVALVGMGPSITAILNQTLTQEFEPSWADEVWAINMASNCIQHDLVWWMDDLDDQEKFKPGLFSALRRRGKPVITTKTYREIVPKSYEYPIDEVAVLSLSQFGKVYLNNGVAMAVAYAMLLGVKTLKMYGCDFTYPNRNYAEAGRACTEAWISYAMARADMDVIVPDNSSIFDAVEGNVGIYGYKTQPKISLPNGSTYDPVTREMTQKKAKKPPEDRIEDLTEKDGYTPPDTRNDTAKKAKKDAVPRHVPGANGASPAVAGPADG